MVTHKRCSGRQHGRTVKFRNLIPLRPYDDGSDITDLKPKMRTHKHAIGKDPRQKASVFFEGPAGLLARTCQVAGNAGERRAGARRSQIRHGEERESERESTAETEHSPLRHTDGIPVISRHDYKH
ncbi:hypothetical protein AAFF_G00218240 [Aldrovandia affinis]|uniref:Uncharacterized protein n=1 Tax=Aldrovandia affinis TaxID=143900 RepID=A0AAD7SW26_9TELE|nr:hypothetical protein AAFF_G00218240 [Aldrovandia affinis]